MRPQRRRRHAPRRPCIRADAHRQALKPNGQFKLTVSGRRVKVNLLPGELIEFNGEVLTIQDERQIDGELATTPGYLDDLN